MATPFATETYRLSNVLKAEFWPDHAFCREVVVVNEAAAKTYAPGTVLGKVTATGKYKIAVETAVDGSKTPAAIVMGDASIAASTDTNLLVIVRGPAVVSKSGLLLDSTYDDNTKKNTAYAALEALSIHVHNAV